MSLAVCGGDLQTVHADSYTLDLQPGFNLISCPVLALPDNSLGSLLPTMPDNAQFWAFDNGSGTCVPPAIFSTTGGWSRDSVLLPGLGAFVYTPTAVQITFTGMPLSVRSYPSYLSSPGFYLLADTVPTAGSSFFDVVGRNPVDGEAVDLWDYASQDYLRTVYDGASGAWSQGTPTLEPGQAAFFELQSVPVPEGPGQYSLLAGLFLCAFGLWHRASQRENGLRALRAVLARDQ